MFLRLAMNRARSKPRVYRAFGACIRCAPRDLSNKCGFISLTYTGGPRSSIYWSLWAYETLRPGKPNWNQRLWLQRPNSQNKPGLTRKCVEGFTGDLCRLDWALVCRVHPPPATSKVGYIKSHAPKCSKYWFGSKQIPKTNPT